MAFIIVNSTAHILKRFDVIIQKKLLQSTVVSLTCQQFTFSCVFKFSSLKKIEFEKYLF